MTGFDDLIAQLASVEERLRDLAYDRLRAAAEDGDADSAAQERQILKARRAVERAIHALGGTSED
ncbi:MAG: hypothetical protein MUP97_12790 [Acidimicrobiia bacterium]|jgi:hypothetical protein|nr:hypothetical protein [Acidimicrobiia bacterium]